MSINGAGAPGPPPQAVIMQMVMGSWVARAISEISRMDIPDALKRGGPQTAGELIAGGVDANELALQRVLRACAGFGSRKAATASSAPLNSRRC